MSSPQNSPETYPMSGWRKALGRCVDPTSKQIVVLPPSEEFRRDEVTLHRAKALGLRSEGMWLAWTRMGPLHLDRSEGQWRISLREIFYLYHPDGAQHRNRAHQWIEQHHLYDVRTKTRGELVTILKAALAR